MAIRWRVLALLFLVRTSMAFQFQAVGALSPVYQEAFAVGIADIGLLIGLYLSPGLFLAAPGGALGRRFGDKRVVLAGLAMMAVGGTLMATSDLWTGQLAGRLVAGIGGVLLNVLMAKMVTDWFAGKEISFSLAIYVNSWPVGIAIALIFLPLLAETSGLTAALALVAALTALGFAGLAMFYRSPSGAGNEPIAAGDRVRGAVLGAVVAAGAIWGFYNTALAIVFSFGPELFIGRGMGLVEAGSVTSIILWMLAIFGSLAGFLIDWTGRRYLILVIGNLGFALFVLIGSWTNQVLANVIAMGLFSGVAVGAMMSLPALVLTPATRAVGMGVFFTVFYFCTATGPMIAGWTADLTGDVAATFHLAVALLIVSVLVLPIYHRLALRTQAEKR
ncbi:MAG: MFS transporter [Paracoccaceae bacterium]|nr:MFS transporter [Paracoccaceae bacterium]